MLADVAQRQLRADLLTGDPLLVDEVMVELADELRRLSELLCIKHLLGEYRDLDGLPELKERFTARCAWELGRAVEADEVLVTPGVQAALRYIHALMRRQRRRLLYPVGLEFPGAYDDETTLPMVAGQLPELAREGDWVKPSFNLSGDDWHNVGAVVLSRPHNPTGRLWPSAEVIMLAAEAHRHNAVVVLDEAYALPFAPLTKFPAPPEVDGPNFVHLYSFSKIGLAGERVGVVVAPPGFIRLLSYEHRRNAIQSSKLGQLLALHAIGLFESRPELARCFGIQLAARWQFVSDSLANCLKQVGVQMAPWEGGPFCWLQWHGEPEDRVIFEWLLATGVAVAPGSSLQVPTRQNLIPNTRGLRIALSRSTEELGIGLDLIGQALRKFRQARQP